MVLQLLRDGDGGGATEGAAEGAAGGAGAAGAAEGAAGGAGAAGDSALSEDSSASAYQSRLLATLADFFGAQPQNAAAAAAARPYLRLPSPSRLATASLMDSRGAAVAAGYGDGESAPRATSEDVARIGAALVDAWRREETAEASKAREARLSAALVACSGGGGNEADGGGGGDGSGGDGFAGGFAQRKVHLGGLAGWGLEALLNDVSAAAAAAEEAEEADEQRAAAAYAKVPASASSAAAAAALAAVLAGDEKPHVEAGGRACGQGGEASAATGGRGAGGEGRARARRSSARAARRRPHDLIVSPPSSTSHRISADSRAHARSLVRSRSCCPTGVWQVMRPSRRSRWVESAGSRLRR